MFSKLKTLKKFSNEIVDIHQLISLVKSNPNFNIINKIRNTQYKSIEYNNLKLKLDCITPHGTFNSLCNEGLNSLSGYLYYDIDGFDTLIELNDTKQKLIDTGYISFICKSVGGKGLSFLVKYDTKSIPNDDFSIVYNHVRNVFIDLGFNIDKSASGLVRKMIISSDNDVYFNNEVSLSIDLISINSSRDFNKLKVNRKRKESNVIIPNDTFNLIPFNELQIKHETEYTKKIDGDFIIDEMSYYKIILPKVIKDGTKHKLYSRIVNALYYINNEISRDEVFSYLYYVNERAKPKMNIKELSRFVLLLCNNIETTGEIRIKPRIKRLHFNKNCNLTKNQKQSMGAKLAGKLKNNKTLKLIEDARIKCLENNWIPTQIKIVELTGLSIATVKRNWNKQLNDINDINIPEIIESINIEEIQEYEFFQKETEIINYKGIKNVEIDKVTPDDKKLFITKINELKSIGFEPSESIMIELNIFDKYKTWFLYDKWIKHKNKLEHEYRKTT